MKWNEERNESREKRVKSETVSVGWGGRVPTNRDLDAHSPTRVDRRGERKEKCKYVLINGVARKYIILEENILF